MRVPPSAPVRPKRKPKPAGGAKRLHVVKPCADPECLNPMGGYIAKGKWLPDRRHGLCKACYARRMRGARGKQLGGRSTKRCANPACPHPSGGYNPKLGAKPLRVHGFCMSCYNLRLRKFKRAMAKQP